MTCRCPLRGRRARAQLALLLCLCAPLASCVKSLTVAAGVSQPARAPVYVFPSVWVAGGQYEEEVYLLDRIAAHLANDKRREVRRVELQDLEPARQAGEISWLTAVVRLSLRLQRSERTHTDLAPMQYCGPYGCGLTSYYTYSTAIPVLRGEIELTVHEGPTARVLSRETFVETVEGDSDAVLRPELIERLADQILRGVDIHLERVAFTLEKTDLRGADEGIVLLYRHKYREGRALLEDAAKSLGGQKKEIQARVWHALAVARVFGLAPGSYDLAPALRALRLAIQTAPEQRAYRATLVRIEELQKQLDVLAEQQKAAAHNFALAAEARGQPATTSSPPAP